MNYEIEEDDEIIVDGMHALEQGKYYRKYITDRFMVEDVHDTDMGLCAHIYDKELEHSEKYHTGDPIADGSIEVLQTGVLFIPERADLASIPLHSELEMSPLHGDKAGHAYNQMVENIRHEPLEILEDEDDQGLVILVLNDSIV
jgi:hypothetical protein